MKRILQLGLLLMLTALMAFTNPEENHCKIAHRGTFVYGSGSTFVKVVINENEHTEYHNNGKYYIKSTIKWINNCEFVVSFREITVPDFEYSTADQMYVKINSVEKKEINFTATINRKSWSGKLIKIK